MKLKHIKVIRNLIKCKNVSKYKEQKQNKTHHFFSTILIPE